MMQNRNLCSNKPDRGGAVGFARINLLSCYYSPTFLEYIFLREVANLPLSSCLCKSYQVVFFVDRLSDKYFGSD